MIKIMNDAMDRRRVAAPTGIAVVPDNSSCSVFRPPRCTIESESGGG